MAAAWVLLLAVLAAPALVTARAPHDSAMNRGLMDFLAREGRDANVLAPPDQWFTQRLDHFDPQNEATFQQRYQTNATFYSAGGPVFLLLGGEGPANGIWIAIDTAIMEYAERFGAMVVQLEHRFYGKTRPRPDLSDASLRFLSSEQALADAAAFISDLKNRLGQDTKVVTFGGSYSGALSGWFRLKYPHLAVGAIATSAPVLAQLNFVAYHEVVAESLRTTAPGAKCTDNIAAATQILQQMVTTREGQATIAADFQLCNKDLSGALDQMNFFENVASNFDGIVQYNKDNRAFEGGTPPPTMDDACAIVTGGPDVYKQYVAFNTYMLKAQNQSCFDTAYGSMVTGLRNTSWAADAAGGMRQWTYQTCVEFGYFQSSDSTKQPFGTMFPLSFSLQQCKDIYGIEGPNVNWTNTYYGGLDIEGSNIVFPNGDVDPWHALSIVSSLSPSLTAIYIHGTAHCANMYPPSVNDPPGLTAARAEIALILATWLL